MPVPEYLIESLRDSIRESGLLSTTPTKDNPAHFKAHFAHSPDTKELECVDVLCYLPQKNENHEYPFHAFHARCNGNISKDIFTIMIAHGYFLGELNERFLVINDTENDFCENKIQMNEKMLQFIEKYAPQSVKK